MNAAEIEKTINKVAGSFAVDGMIVTDEEKNRARRCLNGEITDEQAIQEIKDKYTHLNRENHKALKQLINTKTNA